MARRRAWLTLTAVLVTAVGYGAVVLGTGVVACGISGCGGEGFGPAYAPRSGQIGLLVAGLTLVPLILLTLRERPRRYRAAGAVGALAAGSALAMVVLGLGPNGCPWGQAQARAGPAAFSPGSLTCSPDPNAGRSR